MHEAGEPNALTSKHTRDQFVSAARAFGFGGLPPIDHNVVSKFQDLISRQQPAILLWPAKRNGFAWRAAIPPEDRMDLAMSSTTPIDRNVTNLFRERGGTFVDDLIFEGAEETLYMELNAIGFIEGEAHKRRPQACLKASSIFQNISGIVSARSSSEGPV